MKWIWHAGWASLSCGVAFAPLACRGETQGGPAEMTMAGAKSEDGGDKGETGGTNSTEGTGAGRGMGGEETSPTPSTGGGGSGGAETGGLGGALESGSGGSPGGGSGGRSTDSGDLGEGALDLLFVVDNSVSMAGKQGLLEQAVPGLIERLVSPLCVAGSGVSDDGSPKPSTRGDCSAWGSDYSPEFAPAVDLHVGVITSSMGGFGSESCTNGDETDRALLIPKVRSGAPDPDGTGFLSWTEGASASVGDLTEQLAEQLTSVGEFGCGFEAPLEAWYRFLVDPSPAEELVLDGTNAVSTGPDAAILAQRKEFLRPKSRVAIVLLTDEDDCSMFGGGSYYPNAGYGWLVADRNRTFPIASDACEENPNDECCYSCLQPAPEGCLDTCPDQSEPLSAELDRANLRCFRAKERFGVDLLYPVQRYIDALTQTEIVDAQSGKTVENPLLSVKGVHRNPDDVVFAAIAGVPWQDLATEETLSDPERLTFLTAAELEEAGRWEVILGEPQLPMSDLACRGDNRDPRCGLPEVPPTDPFMIQSIQPRSGSNPLTGDPIVQPTDSGWSPINGHEFDNSVPLADGLPSFDDLQYSCIFPLLEPRLNCAADDFSCDCGDEPSKGRPICKEVEDASTSAGTSQYFGKAYPPKRVLQVLRGIEHAAVLASTCPKIVDPTSEHFGYRPALAALLERITRGR